MSTPSVQELQANIGVSEAIALKMIALEAYVLSESGLLLRTCEHGVRHPVAYVDGRRLSEWDIEKRHERQAPVLVYTSKCCDEACCQPWREAIDPTRREGDGSWPK